MQQLTYILPALQLALLAAFIFNYARLINKLIKNK